MKAIVYKRYGSPEVLQLQEVTKPVPGDYEVLIKVYASCINDWDWGLLQGKPFVNRLLFGLIKPKTQILGCDLSGRVEAIGAKVKQFKPGDEVFGDISEGNWGGFAEYVCADEKVLALKPAGMSFDEAAATPQAGLLALQGLLYNGSIQSGQKVLINGAGGGTGTFAVQIAKLYGAEVTGVDSKVKLEMLRSIGADHVIDYAQEDFTKNGLRYDLILDVRTNRPVSHYKQALNAGGTYVTVGGSMPRIFYLMIFGPLISKMGNKKMSVLMHKPQKKDLIKMSELFDAGKVVPIIDSRYPLREVPQALQRFGQGIQKGKIVITMGDHP
ncbi:MAG: NAD(P)-dependent alcohol dehydrogenase [Balneolales bacterium]